ncbi:PrsW family intramembrane metalloprotease [Streptomyces capparidis]
MGAVTAVLALCGVAILALVQRSVGTEGFLAGIALSVLPVPLLVGAFLWVDRVEPEPRRNLLFAFGWGSCAATLIAIFANGWLTDWLVTVNPGDSETLSLTVVAPVVEEITKGVAIWLLFLFRRQDFDGIVDGVVIAGLTATGFAFTENILYLGTAFGEDMAFGNETLGGATVTTFFMRVIVSPFAHPLFTCMTGLGFALASRSRSPWPRRLAPVGGLLTAMLLHGVWNGSSVLGTTGFVLVYGMFMVPVFGLMVWLAVWSRNNELKTVGRQLPVYAAAGWISAAEPAALASMKGRKLACDLARAAGGEAAARVMREYLGFATSLAFLRARAERRGTSADFGARERALLDQLWHRRAAVQPALAQAAFTVTRPIPPPPGWGPQPGWEARHPRPVAPGYAHGAGYGHPAHGWAPPVQGWAAPAHPPPWPAPPAGPLPHPRPAWGGPAARGGERGGRHR